MAQKKDNFKCVDEYIAQFSFKEREILETLRAAIIKAAPQSEEKISYEIPTFYLNGNLVQFALLKIHIGFYPTPSGIEKFKNELSQYKLSKGSVQFPLDKTLPYDLISEIVKFRVNENKNKENIK